MQTFTFFSIRKKGAFFFSRAEFLVAVSAVLLKKRNPYLSLKKRPRKARPSTLSVQFCCCISLSPAVCRGRYGTMLFSIGSATGDYGMRL